MAEAAPEPCLVLEELPIPGPADHRLPPFWNFALARSDSGERLVWLFRLNSAEDLPRGYFDSVRQRRVQWEGLRSTPQVLSSVFREGHEVPCSLALGMPDGESLPDYLRRAAPLAERTAFRLVAEMVAWLQSLAEAPRLLANVEFGDFFVHARDGILPTTVFCPAFALLREESPRSDYRIARDCYERLSVLHAFLKQGRKGILGAAGADENRAFRPFFKRLESGRDCPLAERFRELEGFFRDESQAAGTGDQAAEPPIESGAFPLGPLASLLCDRGRMAVSGTDVPRTEVPGTEVHDSQAKAPAGKGSTTRFSPYRLEAPGNGSGPDRLALLLPPEAWFENSLVERLNRRLSHPFLKAHHNCQRIRTVYCDETLTLLMGDPATGIPLPSLLTARDGIEREDLFLVMNKLHRALAQFDSADFDPGLISPWQVELHLESGVAHPGWERLLASGIASWPPWETILRVECPTEHFIPGETSDSWRWVYGRLSGKFFPALVAWMLDWKRFQRAAQRGRLETEPLSRDERLIALFEAAAVHLDPSHPPHREKFLSLIEEGLAAE